MSDNFEKVNEEEEEHENPPPRTGVGSIFSYIKENKDTIAEETNAYDNTSAWGDEVPLDQLCDIGSGNRRSLKFQRVSSYYCDICSIDLNSQVTYDMHIEGQKHKKKERNQQHINDVTGEPVPKDIVPRVKKTKVGQSNLRAMLETETEPAIGLQYVVELFPESNESGEHDAMYSCELCCTEGPCASIFAHIKGGKHREKYLGMKYNIINLDKPGLLREAKAIQQHEGKRIKDIRTEFSDAKYPWPPGKRPANSGTKRKVEEMEAPEPLPDPLSEPVGSRAFARRGYNYEPSRSQSEEVPNKPNLANSGVAKVLNALRDCQVKTEEDVEMAHQVSAHLIRAITDYKETTGDPLETKGIQVECDKILDSLYAIRKIQSAGSFSTPRQMEGWKGGVTDYGHGRPAAAPESSYGGGGHSRLSEQEPPIFGNDMQRRGYYSSSDNGSRSNGGSFANSRFAPAASDNGGGGERSVYLSSESTMIERRRSDIARDYDVGDTYNRIPSSQRYNNFR